MRMKSFEPVLGKNEDNAFNEKKGRKSSLVELRFKIYKMIDVRKHVGKCARCSLKLCHTCVVSEHSRKALD
jgi:hypothetical protein